MYFLWCVPFSTKGEKEGIWNICKLRKTYFFFQLFFFFSFPCSGRHVPSSSFLAGTSGFLLIPGAPEVNPWLVPNWGDLFGSGDPFCYNIDIPLQQASRSQLFMEKNHWLVWRTFCFMEEGEKAFMVQNVHRVVCQDAFCKSNPLDLQGFLFHVSAEVIWQCYEKVLLKERKIELKGDWCWSLAANMGMNPVTGRKNIINNCKKKMAKIRNMFWNSPKIIQNRCQT